ncbi:MAG: hypothetical protein KDK59_09280 [Simkania sp.]|nr:hypothetical protein [Simkania sp.]
MQKFLFFLGVSFSALSLYGGDQPAACGYTLEKGTQVYTDAFERAIEFVKMNQIEGDIVEFGTLEGFNATIFAQLMGKYKISHSLHLFDSFEGFPEITSAVDLNSYEVKDYQVWSSGGMALAPNIPTLIQKRLEKIIPKDLHSCS